MKKKVSLGLFIIYIGLIIFMQIRYEAISSDFYISNLKPFNSYLEAWNIFSLGAFRVILVRIASGIPFGILFPMLSKKFNKPWLVIIADALLIIIAKAIAILFGRGWVDIDYALYSVIGAVIGYCLLILFDKNIKLSIKIVSQLPLVLVIGIFAGTMIKYNVQDFGNIYLYTYPRSMIGVDVTCSMELSDEPETAYVYKADMSKFRAPYDFAKSLIESSGESVVTVEDNDNASVYLAGDNGSYVSITDNNMWKSVNYNLSYSDGYIEDKNVDEDEAKQLLHEVGIDVSDEMRFISGESTFTFIYENFMTIENEDIHYGEIQGSVRTNGKIGSLRISTVDGTAYKECDILSEKEVVEQIKKGRYRYLSKGKKIEITNMHLSYEIDSKDYFQPLYYVEAIEDGEKIVYEVKALK